MNKLVIAHLYPREMNTYGDLGNVITLRKRLEWRGYDVDVQAVEIGERFDFAQVDIVFGGGGQDSGQLVIGEDLAKRGAELRQMAASGTPMLTVCGTYQLFGRGFTTSSGQAIPGIELFRAQTMASRERMIGNIVVQSPFGQLVGFENHSGQTLLEPGQAPLGRVISGFGNDAHGGHEGAITNNAIGTYLHGPLLPKNPHLADHLILTALRRRYGVQDLAPLDDPPGLRVRQLGRRRHLVPFGPDVPALRRAS